MIPVNNEYSSFKSMSVVTGFCELGLLFARDVRLREPPGVQAVASEVCVFFFTSETGTISVSCISLYIVFPPRGKLPEVTKADGF